MPKCCKCGAAGTLIKDSFHLSSIEENNLDLGVKSFYLNKDGSNTRLYLYCQPHYEEEVKQLQFVKNAVEKVEAEKRVVENANAALTKDKTDLQTQLDARVKEVQDLKNQFDATTKEQEKTRAERETLSGELKKTTEQLNALKQELKQQKDLVATKDKEIADVRAENLEKAKLHASVKIGLDFSKYHEIPTLLLKWSTRLPLLDHENTLKEIHDRIKALFWKETAKEVDELRQRLDEMSSKSLQELESACKLHQEHIASWESSFKETPKLAYTDSEKISSLTPLKSRLHILEYSLQQLKSFVEELQPHPQAQDPNNPDERPVAVDDID